MKRVVVGLVLILSSSVDAQSVSNEKSNRDEEILLGFLSADARAVFVKALDEERMQIDALVEEEKFKLANIRRGKATKNERATAIKKLRREFLERRRAIVLKSRLELRSKYPDIGIEQGGL